MRISVKTIHHINCNELKLVGKGLTEADFEDVEKQVEELVENNEVNVILNLEEVNVINSLGLKSLIKVFTTCRNHGGDMYIVNISDKISQVLLLTKLNTVLNIATSLNDAINQFAIENES
ncbi:STAS domain-containing protein [Paracrocinitomix mangrovi]|uniref:STAS domain-containing protein n=1 Tax=Paracrocinitomix mangrovi TaxID=2862509 RepID=UPI001C8E840F|nr:STAS domain-containing protein [Paracrocinitomix mangrovi]UKN03009.1 STAS domain-containing protein [Paracrocinitomix mangrovi]